MKREKIYGLYLLSVIYLFLSVSVFGQNMQKIVELKGNWKFTIGDNPEWANPTYNDSFWESLRVPSYWEEQGFYGYNGYAWYRNMFYMPAQYKKRNLILYLGYIDDVNEVYINGKLIGRTGGFPPGFASAWRSERIYNIPNDVLYFDKKNIIAVRIYDSHQSGGITGNKIGIYAGGDKPEIAIDLQGKWKFHLEDNPAWKSISINDTDWDDIYVPGYWENQGYLYYNGFAWYRISFYLPGSLRGKQLVLLLGKIDDIDETYFNGVKVGNTGIFHDDVRRINTSGFWRQYRGYFLPSDVILYNSFNTIAVRVYDEHKNGGIYKGPVGILTHQEYLKFWKSVSKEQPTPATKEYNSIYYLLEQLDIFNFFDF